MLRSISRWFVASTAAAVIVATAAAVSATVPYKERGTGTVTNVVGNRIFFAGGGKATHLGKYTLTGSNDFDLVGNIQNGQVTSTAANGATLSGTYAGTYTPLPTGQLKFDVHVQWSTGTDQLAGVTGAANVVAIIDGISPGSPYVLDGIGQLLFP
jgi:hypothetical protein